MKFQGKILKVQTFSGTSKAGKEWRRQDVVLEYESGQYPKSILFSVMNDNIEKFAFREGMECEVDVNFTTSEYNGRVYMQGNCWRTYGNAQGAPQASTPSTAKPTAKPVAKSKPVQAEIPQEESDDLPF